MKEAFEKLKERLEVEIESSDKYIREYDSSQVQIAWNKGMRKCLEIVSEVEAEYGNGWIPCSERLPDIRQDCLVTVKYSGFMGMHGFWIKTGHMESENDWWGDCMGGTVLAWMPLPSPFKPEKGE